MSPATAVESNSRTIRKLAVGFVLVLVLLAGCGLVAVAALANRSGRTIGEWLKDYQSGRISVFEAGPEAEQGEGLDWFTAMPVGNGFTEPPRISFVEVVDLDQDQRLDVLFCDCVENSLGWLQQQEDGQFVERKILTEVPAPARVECVDIDGDQDLDLLVAVLGKLFPSNDKVAALIALENDGEQGFSSHVLLQDVARVSDVRSGDLDGDGDLDLAVTQFGYYEGGVQWMENQGDWQFVGHPLADLPGGIHGIVTDLNGDDLLDIVVLVSQEYERIDAFYGDGQGEFEETTLYEAGNPDFGSSGISVSDLDGDGDVDILYTNGDAFDYSPPKPWPWHGVQWLENRGGKSFVYHRLVDFGGAVNAKAVDIDQDGNMDILAASAFNAWDDPSSQSLILLKNTGSMRFVVHGLGNAPSHIQALDIADLDGDGQLELVTGGMHIFEPYDRVERLAIWSRLDAASGSSLDSTAVPDGR